MKKKSKYPPDIYSLIRVTDGTVDEVFIPKIQEKAARNFLLNRTKFGSLFLETWQKVRKDGKWIGIKKIKSQLIEV